MSGAVYMATLCLQPLFLSEVLTMITETELDDWVNELLDKKDD